MSAPKSAPAGLRDTPYYTSPDVVPAPWNPDRPGIINGPQPVGPRLGTPGPDQGYALVLARRLAPQLELQTGELEEDVIQGCLGVALKRYVADYSTTHNIATDLTLNEPDMVDLAPAVQFAIFRIVQEALTNVARHSGASAIRIRLARSPMTLETTIEDNGSGFEVMATGVRSEAHLGLQSMRERAAILGGTATVTSGSTGTTIRLEVPLEERHPKPL